MDARNSIVQFHSSVVFIQTHPSQITVTTDFRCQRHIYVNSKRPTYKYQINDTKWTIPNDKYSDPTTAASSASVGGGGADGDWGVVVVACHPNLPPARSTVHRPSPNSPSPDQSPGISDWQNFLVAQLHWR